CIARRPGAKAPENSLRDGCASTAKGGARAICRNLRHAKARNSQSRAANNPAPGGHLACRLQARRNIVGVNPEMAPAISDNSGDRKPDHPVLLFGVEHQAYVFARHTNIAFIAPAIFVREGTGDGLVPNMVHRFFGEITVEAI